ncbi:MAG TPA: D-glycero-beta-D-manno-heptose 1,7-bisphosphate 7-phosphatase [Chromatiales bacterium]|nr:D-glycero-beta-D-manno-heptose 1,7-bisphosphate 7-phosphatase [Chromatiales bacterium]
MNSDRDPGPHRPRLVILDRDGVINRDSDDYIKSPAEWEPLPGSLAAIAALNQAGFTVVIASNQSGLGRGLFTADDLDAIHRKMRDAITAAGGRLDGIYYCPHRPEDNCDCRKPRAGLLKRIAADFDTGLTGVPIIGDSGRDLDAARAVGARPILVRTGNGEQTLRNYPDPDGIEVYADLAAAAQALIAGVH